MLEYLSIGQQQDQRGERMNNIQNSVMKLLLSTVDRRPWQQNFTAHTADANLCSDYNLARNRDGPVKLWNRTVWTDEHKIISVMIRQKCREKLD